MAGPSTESVNNDVKLLREDLHRFDVSIRYDMHQVEMKVVSDIRELTVQVRGILTAIKLLAVLTLTSLAASIWWGATLTADVKNLNERFSERSKAIDARFDKLDASIGKLLDQTKPAPER